MKNWAFAIALFWTVAASAQTVCGWYGTMPVEKRRAAYPFKGAKKVVFISFFSSVYSSVVDSETGEPIKTTDSADVVNKLNVNVLRDFQLSHISPWKIKNYPATEILELDQQEIDSLSRWYFNYRPKRIPNEISIEPVGCYEPRNAILFLDESGKATSFIEVCFQCVSYGIAPRDEAFNQLTQMSGCFEKIEILREMFRKKGITRGVNRR